VGDVAPNYQRGVVLPGGESWVADQMPRFQHLSACAGLQWRHSGSDVLVSKPVAPRLPWTWAVACTADRPAARRQAAPLPAGHRQ